MFFGGAGRYINGLGILLAMLAVTPDVSDGRSLDPATCPSGEKRLAFSSLIFCWPAGAGAPDYKFEAPETMLGSQEIGGSHAIFSIFPVDSSMFRAFGGEIRQKELIGRTVELRAAEADVFTIESDEGNAYGRQMFEFRKVGPKLFAASRILTAGGWPAENVEYLVAMTDNGQLDYVMRCGGFGAKPNCSGQFLLFDNLARIGILSVKDSEDARGAFEVLRSRIRSYVVSPAP